MKNIKKLFALLITMIMVFAMSASVFAAGTGSITITPPTGTDSNTNNTYNIYKVFDADGDGTNISYKLMSGKSAPVEAADHLSKFDVDTAGNVHFYKRATTSADWAVDTTSTELPAGLIAAIKTYVNGDTAVATATSTGTNAATATGLANGYYYIETSTGTAVTIDSTNPSAQVQDKNVVPPVEKKITGVGTGSFDQAGKNAIAEVGTTVTYTATVTVEKGQHNYVFHDKMGTGLTFNGNNSVTVTGINANQYTIKTTPDNGDDLTITFVDGIAENTDITIQYTATVNADALTVDYAKNTATVSYGNNNATSKVPVDPKVYTAGISAVKYDGQNTAATTDDTLLSGAGFKLKNAAGKYYKLSNGVVTWVDAEANGDEHTSGADGKVAEFTGLGSGTYTLTETTVPSGYNKAADVTFTIDTAKADPTTADLHKSSDVLNNKGAELPATGGMGTTIFYVLGSILVIGAGVVMVSRRRMNMN